MIEQNFDRVDAAGSCCHHQRRLAIRQAFIRIGAGFQQALDDGSISIDASERKHTRSLTIHSLRICSGAKQQLRHFQVVPVNGPMQCRRSVSLWQIHVHMLL